MQPISLSVGDKLDTEQSGAMRTKIVFNNFKMSLNFEQLFDIDSIALLNLEIDLNVIAFYELGTMNMYQIYTVGYFSIKILSIPIHLWSTFSFVFGIFLRGIGLEL